MTITNQLNPIEKLEYWRETAKIPDYSLKDLLGLPLLKVTPPVEEITVKNLGNTINYLSPQPALYNSQNMPKYDAPTPLQSLADHVKSGGSFVSSTLEDLFSLPRLDLEQRLTRELTKLPDNYIQSTDRAAASESMLGNNPNPSVIGNLYAMKPYVLRSSPFSQN
ncbi:MAG: hypothetical protein V1702_00170 [Candidatus Woesearchaeota archaeon]